MSEKTKNTQTETAKEKIEKKMLYCFDAGIDETFEKEVEVEREVEVEKDVEVKRRRKNKETGKMENVAVIEKRKTKEKKLVKETREVTEEKPYRILIKKPTRTQLEDGDMFYSLQLNKFIKQGLMTKAMLSKQYSDLGGTFTKEQQDYYGEIYAKYYQKLTQVQRFSVKTEDELSDEQKSRLESAMGDLAILRKQITEYESSQSMLFEHTADVKARNKTIMWYIVNLAHYVEGDQDEYQLEPLFDGANYDQKYDSYRAMEEDEDPLYIKVIDKISSIVTIWYMSGVQNAKDIDEYLSEIDKDIDDEELLEGDLEGDTELVEEA